MQPSPRTPRESSSAVLAIPARVTGHEKRRHSLAALPRLCRRKDDDHARCGGVGDPDFPADQAITIVDPRGRRLLVGGVSARTRFRQGKRADRLTPRQHPKPSVALGVGSGVFDQFGDKGIRDGQRRGHRGARPADRLDGERVAQIVAAGSPPGCGYGQAQQAESRGGANDVGRKLAGRIDGGRARRHDLPRKSRDIVPERSLLRRQIEEHPRSYLRTKNLGALPDVVKGT